VRRSAWVLDGSAPPTLPDRVRGGGAIDTQWVDAAQGRRLHPGCAGAPQARHTVEVARWPTLLEPWIGAELRSAAERLPWAPGCAPRSPSRALRVAGIEPGSVIRAAPGGQPATLRVQAIGASERVHWLLDGQLVGTTDVTAPSLRLTLAHAGEHALTALDAQGRYDRVVFSAR
jgi:penicillin-binding protein 1C